MGAFDRLYGRNLFSIVPSSGSLLVSDNDPSCLFFLLDFELCIHGITRFSFFGGSTDCRCNHFFALSTTEWTLGSISIVAK